MTDDLDAIIEIMDRSEYVRDWPEDERDLHRNGDWASFTERHAAVMRLRAEKIVRLVRSQLPGSHQVVVDREWLAIYFDPGSSVSAKFLAGERLRAALSPEPDIKETP